MSSTDLKNSNSKHFILWSRVSGEIKPSQRVDQAASGVLISSSLSPSLSTSSHLKSSGSAPKLSEILADLTRKQKQNIYCCDEDICFFTMARENEIPMKSARTCYSLRPTHLLLIASLNLSIMIGLRIKHTVSEQISICSYSNPLQSNRSKSKTCPRSECLLRFQ